MLEAGTPRTVVGVVAEVPRGAVRTEHRFDRAEEEADPLVWAVDCSDVAGATATENMKRLKLQVRQETVRSTIHVRAWPL